VNRLLAVADKVIVNNSNNNSNLLPTEKPTVWHTNTYADSHMDNTAVKPGAAADKAAQNKIDRYAAGYIASNHISYRFAIETAGTLYDMAIKLTQEIGRRITEDTKETTFLFQRLYMAPQRGKCGSPSRTP